MVVMVVPVNGMEVSQFFSRTDENSVSIGKN
jgi:hypothetical protein